jgi:hypothetical protein
MTDAALHFLPWLRHGAVGAITDDDPLSGPLPADAAVQPWVRIAGHPDIGQPARLHGPGHVTSVGTHLVLRTQPEDGAADVEPNYFPFVELRTADLPWRYTPTGAGSHAQLRPWLVLVVVRQQEGVLVGPESGAPLPVLRIEPPAVPSAELPDLADSAAWVHVQSTLPAAEVATGLDADPAAAFTRLICPRRLLPDESWHACLVPAFDLGVLAGLGADGAVAGQVAPAWDVTDRALDEATLRLPVYYHWTFGTGPGGDFESLAERLEPEDGETALGRVDLDVSHPGPPVGDPPRLGSALVAPVPPGPVPPGPVPPRPVPARADFVGALKTPGVRRGGAPEDYQDWFERALEPPLERGARRVTVPAEPPAGYDPRRDDPVVAPPLYGSVQAGRFDLPDDTADPKAWLRSLGLTPELRAVAGLGAELVRTNQESLLASAWAQAGAVAETGRALDAALLAVETGRVLARQVQALDSGSVVQVTRPAHAWVAVPGGTGSLARELDRGPVPGGLVGAPFQRATRPAGGLGRLWRANPPTSGETALTPAVTAAFVAATSPQAEADLRGTLGYASFALPVGAWTHDAALDAEAGQAAAARAPLTATVSALTLTVLGSTSVVAPSGTRFDGTLAGALALEREVRALRVRPRRATEPLAAGASRAAPAEAALVDLSAAAEAVIAGLDPLAAVTAGLLDRIPALSWLLTADGALPGRVVLHPVFTDPLYLDLVRMDPRFFLPGSDQLAENRVALLNADDDFVAAFLAGANHELARELVWREFPTLPSFTFFHRFWDSGPGGADDIEEISGWTDPRLGGNLTGLSAGELSVVLVRADLLRRYPDAHIYLIRGVWDGDAVVPDDTVYSEPILQGALDRRTVFYGYPIKASALRGDRAGDDRTEETAGWYVAIEEPATGPRFGLDIAAEDGSDLSRGAGSWNHLSWGHLVPAGGSLGDLTHAVAHEPLPPRTPATLDGLTWGQNAAHMAAITWQRPYRVLIHADLLLPA